MNQFALTFLLFAAIVSSSCYRADANRERLAAAMHDQRLESVRDIKHRESGLREQVDEWFFRVNPAELKEVLAKAGFVRDDAIPAVVRRANSAFKDLVGGADQPDAIGFRRIDLSAKEGKYCHLLCAGDFSWAYLLYVNVRGS